MVYILAKTHAEAEHWAREIGFLKWKYVSRPSVIRGLYPRGNYYFIVDSSHRTNCGFIYSFTELISELRLMRIDEIVISKNNRPTKYEKG